MAISLCTSLGSSARKQSGIGGRQLARLLNDGVHRSRLYTTEQIEIEKGPPTKFCPKMRSPRWRWQGDFCHLTERTLHELKEASYCLPQITLVGINRAGYGSYGIKTRRRQEHAALGNAAVWQRLTDAPRIWPGKCANQWRVGETASHLCSGNFQTTRTTWPQTLHLSSQNFPVTLEY